MERIVKHLTYLAQCTNFRKFQNSLADDAYRAIAEQYSQARGYEIPMVSSLCNALHDKNWNQFRIHAEKIHGSRSQVSFNMQGTKKNKELGDTVFISLAASGGRVVLAKMAIVQNKRESSPKRWGIDQEQLFLLEHFPSFSGVKGIPSKLDRKEMTFLNVSGQLGNFGFFENPGEMYFVDAATVSRARHGNSVHLNELFRASRANQKTTSWPYLTDPYLLEEIIHFHLKRFPYFLYDLPFSESRTCVLNLQELIRCLTMLKVGEVIEANGRIFDQHLHSFTKQLLRTICPNWDISFSQEENTDSLIEIDASEYEGLAVVAILHSLEG